MGRLTDIGSRNIFTDEQVSKKHVNIWHLLLKPRHQDMFREAVRRFMREEVAPQQKAFEEVGQPTREIWRALGKMVSAYKCWYIKKGLLLFNSMKEKLKLQILSITSFSICNPSHFKTLSRPRDCWEWTSQLKLVVSVDPSLRSRSW